MGREEMRKEDLSSCAGFPSALAPPTLRPVRANEIENLNCQQSTKKISLVEKYNL